MKPPAFKILGLFFLCVASQLCFAAGDTNIIAMSEWSKSVPLKSHQGYDVDIHGRLLIVQGTEPAAGWPPSTNGAMTFVELQNTAQSHTEVFFAVTNLHCELSDAQGKAATLDPVHGWGGRGPLSPYWVTLPYNSTIRLFVNGGSKEPLMLYPSGEPWTRWSIPKTDTNIYYLSGTLTIVTHTNSSSFLGHKATLVFPKTKIPKFNDLTSAPR